MPLDENEKQLLRLIVERLNIANDQAHDAYFYARQLELTLRNVPDFGNRFGQELKAVQENTDKIQELAHLKRQHKPSKENPDEDPINKLLKKL